MNLYRQIDANCASSQQYQYNNIRTQKKMSGQKEVRTGADMEFYLNTTEGMNVTAVLMPPDVIRPSEYDGFSLEEENNLRLFGCELIQEAGIMLKLPQVTMITAMELFHRFCFRKSFLDTDLRHVVSACLFLATKLEETPKKIRDVVSVFDYLLKVKAKVPPPIPVLDLNSNEFILYRQALINAERLVLKEIGFSLNHLAVKPFKYLYYYLKLLKLNKVFAQKAWNYINDAYRVPVCASFPPHVLAASAIYLASQALDYPLPDVEWWVAFDCNLEDIEEVAAEILKLYQMKKVTLEYVHDTIKKHMPPDTPIEVTKPMDITPPREETKVIQVEERDTKKEIVQEKIMEKREGRREERRRSRSNHRRKRSRSRDRKRRESSRRSKSRSRHRGRRNERRKEEGRKNRKEKSRRESSRREKSDEEKKEPEEMQDADMHYYDRLEKEKSNEDFYAEYLRLSKQRDKAGNKQSYDLVKLYSVPLFM
eukprot:TRINITY_DN105022_c0_g1_i1.p3 TRINITY_DN105022_c0_g1~~TRINITY_DN105022_c0_g1_i1.p3  ORF type:complete len:481 (+),score=49.20 TRINITY_DN105022_c0_g1_i1:4477-5919(+)